MSQDLGRAGEWDRLAPLVIVVVGMPREDVEVGAAQAHGRDAHQHVARPRLLARHVAQLDPADVDENGGSHGRRVEDGGGWGRLWRFGRSQPPQPPEPPTPTRTSVSRTSTDAMVLGGTVGSRTARPESLSIVSGFPSASM